MNIPSVASPHTDREQKRHKKRHRVGFWSPKIFIFERKTAILCVRSDSDIEYEAAKWSVKPQCSRANTLTDTETDTDRHTERTAQSTAIGMEIEESESEWSIGMEWSIEEWEWSPGNRNPGASRKSGL